MTDGYVAALLHEREGYKAAGPRMKDRLRAVDAELARLGYGVEDDAPETATVRPENAAKPRGRPRKG